MIDIFQPLNYKIPEPVPDEISIIRSSNIERYAIDRIPCSLHLIQMEGFFRLRGKNPRTEHIKYVLGKILQIYEVVKGLDPDSMIIRIDYFLDSGSMIGVYVREDIKVMIGCVRGYRADRMTQEESQELWGGPLTE